MKKSLVIPTIEYVDALPGVGKTRAAIEFMRQHVEAGLRGGLVGHIIYVAPTKRLLHQTYDQLINIFSLGNLPQEEVNRHVRILYSTVADKFSKSSVMSSIDSFLRVQPEGSILFITHQAFLQLSKYSCFHRTTVLFDEARKWATLKKTIVFNTKGMEEGFKKMFTSHRLGLGVVQLLPKEPSKKLEKELASKLGMGFSVLKELHKELVIPEGGVSRRVIFGIVKKKKAISVVNGRKKIKITRKLVQITLPSKPFQGFQRVIILSAAFKTSQMFHLLTRERCELSNITTKFLTEYGYDWTMGLRVRISLESSLVSVHNRYSSMILVPLILDEKVPSKHKYLHNLLVPLHNHHKVSELVKDQGLKLNKLRDYLAHEKKYSSNKGVTHIITKMKKLQCVDDPLKWMVNSAQLVTKDWLDHTKGLKNSKSGLMFLNKDWIDSHGESLNKRLYHFLSIGKVEGQNDYRDRCTMCFLAAVNPQPELAEVLKLIMPDYNPDEDHVVDKAIQALGRGNIRDPFSTDPMLAIVATAGLAHKIQNKLDNIPQIDKSWIEKLGNYVYLNRKETSKSDEERAERKKKAQQSFREKMGPRYLSVMSMLNSCKKKLKTTNTRIDISSEEKVKLKERLRSRISKLETELEQIRVTRLAGKD
jgi:hypothetical protein